MPQNKKRKTAHHLSEERYHLSLQETLEKIVELESMAMPNHLSDVTKTIVNILREIAPKKMNENDKSQNHNETLVDTHIRLSTESLEQSSNGKAQNQHEQGLYKVYLAFCKRLKELHKAKNNLTEKSKTATEQKQVTIASGMGNGC